MRIALADNAFVPSASPSPQYVITDLGSLGGLLTVPANINDAGQIVGYSQSPDTVVHAFLWQRGKMTALGELKGDASSMVYAINNKGQAVGVSMREGKVTHGVLWSRGAVISLGSIGDGKLNKGYVNLINDNGQMIVNRISWPNNANSDPLKNPAQFFNPANQHHRILLCTNGSLQNGRLLGANIVDAIAMNNSGAVVGEKLDCPRGCLSGYLWKDGVLTDLGKLEPRGINENGEVIGTLRAGKPESAVAAVWKNGTVTLLHFSGSTRTFGYAINDSGQSIGVTGPAAELTTPHAALLWKDSQCMNFTESFAARGDWKQIQPTAINNSGQIVGCGLHHNKIAAFLLTPITP